MTVQYIAKDGQIFDDKNKCIKYEKSLENALVDELNGYICDIVTYNSYCQTDKRKELPAAFDRYMKLKSIIKTREKDILKGKLLVEDICEDYGYFLESYSQVESFGYSKKRMFLKNVVLHAYKSYDRSLHSYLRHRNLLLETLYQAKHYLTVNKDRIKEFLNSDENAYKSIDKRGLSLVYSIINK